MICRLGVLVVVVAYTSVTSALPPCICTREMKPVCGTDGETYNNMCLLRCQQQSNPSLELQSRGHCRETSNEETCICSFEHDPVCGSDGRTYPNKCAMDCDSKNRGNVVMVHKGECRSKREVAAERMCLCPYNYAPVCGSDGETYGNECSLKCEDNVEVAYRGACRTKRESCLCPLNYDPVCGSDGQTYGNQCALECAGLSDVTVEHTGECRSKREVAAERMCLCPYNYAPVCGSDGETYGNECSLKCEDNVEVAYRGACRAKRESCLCPLNYDPVCGSDGQTYGNQCALECAGLSDVTVAYAGECKSKREVCLCPDNYAPVCGSDGKTYENECSLKCEDNVEVAYQGACKDKREVEDEGPACFCTFENDPVCGSNGKTYDNMCALECEGETVQLAYKGECRVKRESVTFGEPAPCVCTLETKPVCGTDGQTYSSACLLNCVSQRREDLRVLHPGHCHTVQVREVNLNAQPACTCTRNLQPVCASDGHTYSNECIMRCSGHGLTVQNDGPCDNSGWPKPHYSSE